MKEGPTKLYANPEVVIIGAGAAGLSAAKDLIAAGKHVLVLEAANQIGGRCVTDTSAFSVPFDVGGSWLHSAQVNPLAQLASANGVGLHKSPWSWFHVHALGHRFDEDEVRQYNQNQKALWQAVRQAAKSPDDVSIQQAMPAGKWNETIKHSVAQMLAGDAECTSCIDAANYHFADGDWLVEGGLGRYIAELHNSVPVVLNCKVAKVDYSATKVALETNLGRIETDQVVVTVSTGVLQAAKIAFHPPLPAKKKDAIDGLPNGLLNKIGIEFDAKWGAAAQGEMADYHTSKDEFCSILFGFYGSGLAVGFVAGKFADALEQSGHGEATAFCLEAIKNLFGSDATKHALRTHETAWRSNQFAVGSYSYAKPGHATARKTLAEPVDERLYFAGEATEVSTYSTVHGAYLSGQRVAREILAVQSGTRKIMETQEWQR